jgi:hypothetical protein
MLVALKLAKAGYGTPQQVLAMPLDQVIAMIAYENFLPQFEEAFYEMNKNEHS